MLQIENLSIKTREPILSDFSYGFESGKLYGMVATNGSGKTTFFRAVTGLIKIESGTIKLDNQPLETQKGKIFYFETSDWLDKNMTGLDYLNFIKAEWQSHQEIQPIIDFWQMADYIRIPVKKYSLGMKQRLLIAMYQVSQAEIMLMDEITNGLDESSRKQLFEGLQDLLKNGTTIILASHYKEDILPICDYLISLENCVMKVSQL